MGKNNFDLMDSGAHPGRALASQDPRRMPILQGTPIFDDTDVMGAVDDLELMAAPPQQAVINYYQNRGAMQQAPHPTHVQMLQQAADMQSGIPAHQPPCNMVGMAPPAHNLMSYGARAAAFLMPGPPQYAAQAPYSNAPSMPDTLQGPSSHPDGPSADSADSLKRKRIRYTDTFKKAKRCEGEKKRIKKISETIEKIKGELETNANAPRDLARQDVLDMALRRLVELHRQNVTLTQLVQVQVMQQQQEQANKQ